MNAEFAGDGADRPVFGVKVVTDLDAGFGTNHAMTHLLRKMRGDVSTKRPGRPQIRQHCHTPGRVSGLACRNARLDLADTAAVRTATGSHPDDAGEVIEMEP